MAAADAQAGSVNIDPRPLTEVHPADRAGEVSPLPERDELGTSSPPHYAIGRLEAATWDAFADLVERNNGIYGGCWCIAHHVEYERRVSDPRTLKEELVRAGRAHAALVFDDDGVAQGWCQYGTPEELDLRFGREYGKDPPPPARWRITCIFVDKRHRERGIARAALEGALGQIAAAGGGLVEAISETTIGRETQARFFQWHLRVVRGARLHPDPSGRQARLDHEAHGRGRRRIAPSRGATGARDTSSRAVRAVRTRRRAGVPGTRPER